MSAEELVVTGVGLVSPKAQKPSLKYSNEEVVDISKPDEPFVLVKMSVQTYNKFLAQFNDDASESSHASVGASAHTTQIRGAWSKDEDVKLLELVKKFGPKKWSTIAAHLPGRIGKQCRERYLNHLDPSIIKNRAWSEEEDKLIIEMHAKYGNAWARMSRCLPGRTANAIKNHWNSTLRRQREKSSTPPIFDSPPTFPFIHPATPLSSSLPQLAPSTPLFAQHSGVATSLTAKFMLDSAKRHFEDASNSDTECCGPDAKRNKIDFNTLFDSESMYSNHSSEESSPHEEDIKDSTRMSCSYRQLTPLTLEDSEADLARFSSESVLELDSMGILDSSIPTVEFMPTTNYLLLSPKKEPL